MRDAILIFIRCPYYPYPYYTKLLGSDGDVQMDLHDYACISMPRGRAVAPERYRTPHGRATGPCLPHTTALGDPGERTGAEAQLGERGASKGAVPGPRYGRRLLKHGNPNTIQNKLLGLHHSSIAFGRNGPFEHN